MIGKVINKAMKFNSLPDVIRVIILLLSFDEISNEITDHQLFVGAGEVDVG